MGIPRLFRFLFIQGVQYFLLRVVVQDGHINEPDKPFILVFAPEGFQDGGMRNGLVVFLVICFPVPAIFRISPKHHLHPLHAMVKAFAGHTRKGIEYQPTIDIIPYHAHDGVVEYSPREVILFVNNPVLSGIIVYLHFRVIRFGKVQGKNHPLQPFQIFLLVKVVAPDMAVLLHFPCLCLLISCHQVIPGGNLFQDVTFSFYHTNNLLQIQ